MLTATAGLLLASALPASAAPEEKVTLCHATGSETNPYELIEVSAAGAKNGHLGEGHQNGEDIIPQFTFRGETYGPQGDQTILANGCVAADGDVNGNGGAAEGAAGGGTTSGAGPTTGGPIPRAVDAGQQSVDGWQLPVGATLTALGLLSGLVAMLRRTSAAS